MESLFGPDWVAVLAIAGAIAFVAGLVKGIVGFAMPMVMISGLSGMMPPYVALAGLILPTLTTNLWQAFWQGPRAAWGSLRRFRVFLLAGLFFMIAGAQLVPFLSASVMLLMLGIPVSAYGILSLAGRSPSLPGNPGPKAEGLIGAVSGFVGGVSGIWGPVTVAMLTALQTEKLEQIRILGVMFGLGSLVLMLAHIGSGVFNAQTAVFSAALVLPALAGLGIGFALQDRIDQVLFRRLTLVVLVISGLNLVRRGLLTL